MPPCKWRKHTQTKTVNNLHNVAPPTNLNHTHGINHKYGVCPQGLTSRPPSVTLHTLPLEVKYQIWKLIAPTGHEDSEGLTMIVLVSLWTQRDQWALDKGQNKDSQNAITSNVGNIKGDKNNHFFQLL